MAKFGSAVTYAKARTSRRRETSTEAQDEALEIARKARERAKAAKAKADAELDEIDEVLETNDAELSDMLDYLDEEFATNPEMESPALFVRGFVQKGGQ